MFKFENGSVYLAYHSCKSCDGILTCFVMILEVGEDKEDDFIAVNDEFTENVEYVGEDYSNICQAGQSQQDVEKSAIELLASRFWLDILLTLF